MLEGSDLGAALTQAMALKGIGPSALARQFKVTPSSIGDWRKRGCIHKRHIGPLVAFFSDVVPPTHWGLQAAQHRHMGMPASGEPRPLTPGLYTVEGDRSKIEQRSAALERNFSDFDPARFSPMAIELARQLDAIRDDKRQLESFVKCIAIVTQAQT